MINYSVLMLLPLMLMQATFAMNNDEWSYCQFYANFQEYKNNPQKKLPADQTVLLKQADIIIKGLEEKTNAKKIAFRIMGKSLTTIGCCFATLFPFTPDAQECLYSESMIGYLVGVVLMGGGAMGVYFQGYKGCGTAFGDLKDRNYYLQVKKENEEVRDWLKALNK